MAHLTVREFRRMIIDHALYKYLNEEFLSFNS